MPTPVEQQGRSTEVRGLPGLTMMEETEDEEEEGLR